MSGHVSEGKASKVRNKRKKREKKQVDKGSRKAGLGDGVGGNGTLMRLH